MVGARGVVVTLAGWVGESVVCVVYLLECLGSGRTFWGIGGNTIGVRFQGLSVQSKNQSHLLYVSELLRRRTSCMRRGSLAE